MYSGCLHAGAGKTHRVRSHRKVKNKCECERESEQCCRLEQFRALHGHLQPELMPLINGLGGSVMRFDIWQPDLLFSALYTLVWMLDGLTCKRNRRRAIQNRTRVRLQLAVYSVPSHLFSYHVLRMKMIHSSRVAGMVSLLGLAEYALKRRL